MENFPASVHSVRSSEIESRCPRSKVADRNKTSTESLSIDLFSGWILRLIHTSADFVVDSCVSADRMEIFYSFVLIEKMLPILATFCTAN